ncbi:SIMPL domain-containing protein [Natronomonas amylolytica]|uniref:SIMPL domain-containing protein n=1 Tax=Natronomonas amylolytica TaxID=3108498 RepID=UPI003009C15B
MQRDALPVLVVVVALLGAALAGAAVVTATNDDGTASGPADRAITVDATGEAQAPPNQAVVRVAATAEGDNASAVRDALAADADALREELTAAGIDESAYETTEYRIHEQRRPPREGEREEPTYRGVHAFEVTLDDPDRAGDVIDAAANADAEVGAVRFTLSEETRDELREDAIADAMGDARTQADAIAANGGLQVTNVATVDASQQRYRPISYDGAAAVAERSAGADTQLDTGEVSVSYQVRVSYNATAAN